MVQYGPQLFPFPLSEVVNGTKIANRTVPLLPSTVVQYLKGGARLSAERWLTENRHLYSYFFSCYSTTKWPSSAIFFACVLRLSPYISVPSLVKISLCFFVSLDDYNSADHIIIIKGFYISYRDSASGKNLISSYKETVCAVRTFTMSASAWSSSTCPW